MAMSCTSTDQSVCLLESIKFDQTTDDEDEAEQLKSPTTFHGSIFLSNHFCPKLKSMVENEESFLSIQQSEYPLKSGGFCVCDA